MDHPFIFSGAGVSQAANDPASFRTQSVKRFGEAAERLRCGYSDWPMGPSSRAVWSNALAAEALLFPPAYRQNNPPFTGFVSDDALPGGDAMPKYGVMKHFPAAAALFPMSGDSPRIGRIWAVGAVRDGDLPPGLPFKLDGSEDVLAVTNQQRVRLYTETREGDGCDVTGKSWHLAAHMAMDALLEDDLEYRIRLASEWLITGEVNRVGRVMGVGVSNKPMCALDSRRRWLVPDASLDTFRLAARLCRLPEPSVTAAGTLGDAVEAVRGCVARRRPNEDWPSEAVCAHIAVAASAGPVWRLLEHIRFRELHLWPLGEHPGVAGGLQVMLREKFPRLKVQTHKDVSADALDVISLALHNHFGVAARAGDTLFDVTAGSWLFRVGVEGVARRIGFPIVCQESDLSPYVKVWYERGVTRYCRMVPADARPTLLRAPYSGKSRTVLSQDPL